MSDLDAIRREAMRFPIREFFLMCAIGLLTFFIMYQGLMALSHGGI